LLQDNSSYLGGSVNPYEILNVNKFSSKDDIKKRYHKLSLEHHPDRGGDSNIFKKVTESYQWLLKNHISKTSGNSKEFFRDVYKSMRKSVPTHLIRIDIPLEDAIVGFDKKIKISLDVPCPECISITRRACNTCGGSGMLTEDKEEVLSFSKVAQQNEIVTFKDFHKGITLLVKIHVVSDKGFKIRSKHIESSEEISIFKTLAGGDVEIDTAYGKFKITLPMGKIASFTYLLKGKGLCGGNHLVNFKVFPPKQLTKQQVELLNRLYEDER